MVNPSEVVVVAELQPLITALTGGAMLRTPKAKVDERTTANVRRVFRFKERS
jgi:hypothetical protein